jgi:hypothetical protein
VVATVAVGLSIAIWNTSYGADNDTWLMLGTWDGLVDSGRYVPSRFQGSPVGELGIGLLSWVGGFRLSNAASFALAVLSLILLRRLLKGRTRRTIDATLLTAIVGVSAPFILAASTSHDYMYGLAPFLGGLFLAERWASTRRDEKGHRPRDLLWAALLFGLASGARLTYIVLGLLVIALVPAPSDLRGTVAPRIYGLSLAGLTGAVCYLPGFVSSDQGLSFFGSGRPTGQGLAGLLFRALVKPSWALGLLATVLAVVGFGGLVIAAARSHNLRRVASEERHLIAVVVASAAVWCWLPAEPAYLLPALAAVAIIAGRLTLAVVRRPRRTTAALSILLLLVAFNDLVAVTAVSPEYSNVYGSDSCDATEASGASVRLSLDAGEVVDYPALMRATEDCNVRERELRRASARS